MIKETLVLAALAIAQPSVVDGDTVKIAGVRGRLPSPIRSLSSLCNHGCKNRISSRLRFGRFLHFITTVIKTDSLPANLTERHFHQSPPDPFTNSSRGHAGAMRQHLHCCRPKLRIPEPTPRKLYSELVRALFAFRRVSCRSRRVRLKPKFKCALNRSSEEIVHLHELLPRPVAMQVIDFFKKNGRREHAHQNAADSPRRSMGPRPHSPAGSPRAAQGIP